MAVAAAVAMVTAVAVVVGAMTMPVWCLSISGMVSMPQVLASVRRVVPVTLVVFLSHAALSRVNSGGSLRVEAIVIRDETQPEAAMDEAERVAAIAVNFFL